MALLKDVARCPGTGCPNRDSCKRFPLPGERLQERAVMTALYVRREQGALACDDFLPRPAEEVPDAA